MQEAPNEYKIDFGPYSVELKSSQVYFKKNNSLMKAIPVKSTFGLYDLKKLAKKVASSVNMTNKLPKDVLKAEKDNGRDLLKGVDESTKEWTKTIKRLAKQDQLKKITSKDKETLLKIVRLMKTANENKIEEDFVKKGFLYKSLTYKVTDQQAVYNAYKKFKMGNKTINIVASNKGDTVTFSGHPQKGPWLAPSIADQLDMAIQKTGKAKLIDSEIKKLKESKMNKSEILFRKMIREIAEPMLTEELNESAIDYRLDPYEDREKLKNQFIKFIISKKRASKNVAKKFVDKHYEKLINIGKDSEILDIYKDLTEAELNEAKYNISKMYPNSTDLERDIVAWYRSLKKDVGEKYAKEMRADLVKVLMREGKLNESREFVIIDPRGNARPVGSKMQASQYTKKMGGPNKGWFIVLKKNALKARRAIEKSGMRYKDSKLQDTMFDLMYEGKLNESMIGIKTKANFKPLQLKGALEKAKIKGFQMNRLSVTLTALKLDKKYYKEAMKIIDDLGLAVMMAKEGKLTEAARAMDWIEDAYGEIGQIHKVRGRAAYVKFPSTKDIAFDVVDIQTLKKTGKKHKGKDLYLAESNINLDTDKLGIVENLTNKEMMVLIEKLKMKQDRPMLTWKSPGDGVHVMVVQSGAVKAIFPHKGDIDEAKTAMKILKVKGLKVIGELNERLDHESAMDILDAAAGYTSTAHVAANQQWWDAQALYDYLISDHIPKKFHKKFFKSIGKKYKLKETIDLRKIFMKGRKKKRTTDEGKITERLAKGLKPLLKLGSTITKKTGEDKLLKLSDAFDRIDDEYAGEIASWLDMAIELMQDGYAGDATKKLKQFNQKCKDVLKGKSIKSAFAEGKLNEAEYGTPIGTKTLKSIDAKFDDEVFKKPPHRIDKAWVLKIAKKHKVDPKKAIEWVNQNPKINIKEGDKVMNEATAKDTLKNAVVALTKTFGGKKIDKNYVKKYLKSIEQIAKRKPQDFVKDYGDFEVKDWIEDAEYNMQNEGKLNEGKISTKRLSEIIIEEYEKLSENNKAYFVDLKSKGGNVFKQNKVSGNFQGALIRKVKASSLIGDWGDGLEEIRFKDIDTSGSTAEVIPKTASPAEKKAFEKLVKTTVSQLEKILNTGTKECQKLGGSERGEKYQNTLIRALIDKCRKYY